MALAGASLNRSQVTVRIPAPGPGPVRLTFKDGPVTDQFNAAGKPTTKMDSSDAATRGGKQKAAAAPPAETQPEARQAKKLKTMKQSLSTLVSSSSSAAAQEKDGEQAKESEQDVDGSSRVFDALEFNSNASVPMDFEADQVSRLSLLDASSFDNLDKAKAKLETLLAERHQMKGALRHYYESDHSLLAGSNERSQDSHSFRSSSSSSSSSSSAAAAAAAVASEGRAAASIRLALEASGAASTSTPLDSAAPRMAANPSAPPASKVAMFKDQHARGATPASLAAGPEPGRGAARSIQLQVRFVITSPNHPGAVLVDPASQELPGGAALPFGEDLAAFVRQQALASTGIDFPGKTLRCGATDDALSAHSHEVRMYYYGEVVVSAGDGGDGGGGDDGDDAALPTQEAPCATSWPSPCLWAPASALVARRASLGPILS